MDEAPNPVPRKVRRRAVAAESPRPDGILARLRSVRQRIGPLRSAAAAQTNEYGFLVGRSIDAATLRTAERIAEQWAVAPHEVLIALGWLDERDYVAALARTLGVEWIGRTAPAGRLAASPQAYAARSGEVVIGAYAQRPHALRQAISFLPPSQRAVLATRREIDAIQLAGAQAALIDHAIEGLWRADRSASARWGAETWQVIVAVAVIGLFIGGAAVAPDVIVPLMLAVLTLPFLCIVLLRSAAVVELLRPTVHAPMRSLVPDTELPRYSAMVALYREARVLPDLVEAMAALDYPSAKLDVLLVLEASDTETLEAVSALDLPGNIRPVVVPDKGPRTKPKALNYALELVTSPYVVVFDAEDIPEPDQIRRALSAFAEGSDDVACVQARLAIHNARQGWLPSQFALEYASLFDGQLPALERLGLPIPLGGTSNHFRVDRLKEVGGWDPYNVTEDADLGFRLARGGYRALTIASTTWEEAPIGLRSWVKQRTRWLKGWMQTYLVHTRLRGRLRRRTGWRERFDVHVVIGGMLLSALVHPICLATVAYQAATGELLAPTQSAIDRALVWLGILNLVLGYASAMMAGAIAAWRRGWRRLALQALLMPVYWQLISFASYRALVQLFFDPHRWEKTEHGHSRGLAQDRGVPTTPA
jgi:cellulose synthase/poly-beta-1,6-N-acetylglucosamine synthase-like glycosyltransferase